MKFKRWLIRDAFPDQPQNMKEFPRYRFFGDWEWIGWKGELSHFQLDPGNLSIVLWRKGEGPNG